jgi:hypothetical protein
MINIRDIKEYTRELRDGVIQTMYKTKWGNEEYHSSDLTKVEDWLEDKVTNHEYYKELMELEDKAIKAFLDIKN